MSPRKCIQRIVKQTQEVHFTNNGRNNAGTFRYERFESVTESYECWKFLLRYASFQKRIDSIQKNFRTKIQFVVIVVSIVTHVLRRKKNASECFFAVRFVRIRFQRRRRRIFLLFLSTSGDTRGVVVARRCFFQTNK